MPLTTNTAQGTVNYSPEGFFNRGFVLANDTADFVHTALTNVTDFDIAVGKYERVFGEMVLFYQSNTTSELKFKFKLADSSASAIASTMYYDCRATIVQDTDADITVGGTAQSVEAVTVTSGDGEGPVITVEGGGSETDGRFVRISFNVLGNAATNGTLQFWAGEIADGSNCHLLAGSYITYKKY